MTLKTKKKNNKFPTVTDSELETLVFVSQIWMLLNQLDQKTKNGTPSELAIELLLEAGDEILRGRG